jgi:hypothetical protein
MTSRIGKLMDFKRNNKLNIGHNVTKAFDFHDIVRLLIMKELRRRHRSEYPIYSEHDPVNPNEDYPDIWMRLGKDIYVWELQSAISPLWQKNICKRYEDVNLIIVPLNDIYSKWIKELNLEQKEPLDVLRKLLDDYII